MIRSCTALITVVLMLTACASQMVGRQCSDAGYAPGTAEYASCYDSTLAARGQAVERAEEQDARDAADPLPGSGGFVPPP